MVETETTRNNGRKKEESICLIERIQQAISFILSCSGLREHVSYVKDRFLLFHKTVSRFLQRGTTRILDRPPGKSKWGLEWTVRAEWRWYFSSHKNDSSLHLRLDHILDLHRNKSFLPPGSDLFLQLSLRKSITYCCQTPPINIQSASYNFSLLFATISIQVTIELWERSSRSIFKCRNEVDFSMEKYITKWRWNF